MIGELKLYCKYIKLHWLSGLEYKGWWLMVLQVMLVVVCDLISTFLLFARFGGIGVWTMERIVLIYAMALTSFGLAESLCRGFDYFPWKMIRSGDFDRLLLRPRSLFIQVAGSFFHIHRLVRVAVGITAVFWSLSVQGIALSAFNILIIVMALVGGMLTYCGVFVMSSGIAFFTIRALDWIYIFTNASYQVTRCPVDHMPHILKYMFSFFIPILFISYYPAAVVCGWGESVFMGLIALPAGIVFLCISLLIWRIGVRHYKSTGS